MRREPSLASRARWWLEDRVVEPTRANAKVVATLAGVALLVLGGLAARQVVRAQASTTPQRLVRLTTTVRQLERVRRNGRTVVVWRVRRKVVYARPQTVLQTQTIHTPTGTRVVTRPVTRYHVVYRKHVVTVHGKARTVSRPVTEARTQTSTVRVTQPVTVTQVRSTTKQTTTTVVQTTTDVQTTTVITTITLPGTTVTVTVP